MSVGRFPGDSFLSSSIDDSAERMAEEIINNIPSADLDAMLESLFGHAEQVPDAAPFPSNIPDAAPLLPVSTPVRGIPSSPSSSTANVAFMLDSQGDSARFLQGVGSVETKHEEKEIKLTVYDYQPLKDYACHVQHAGKGKANVLCLQFRDEKHFNSFNDRWDRKRKKYCSEENDIVFTMVDQMSLAEGGVLAYCVRMPLEFTLTARDTQSAILDPRAQSGLIDILTEAGMLKSKFAMRAEASDEIREWLEENFRNGDFYQQMHDAGFVKETAPVVERRRSIG